MDARTLWLMLPRPVRELPADLAAVLGMVLAADIAALAPVISETPLRIPLGLALVLFLPGYAFIAALFPEGGESPSDATTASGADSNDTEGTDEGWLVPPIGRSGIDGIERVALSFGLSIAIVPLLGLLLNFTPWGIRLVPIVVTVSGFTLVATLVAAVRRWDLPPVDRFRVPYRDWYNAASDELFNPETRVDAALNVALAASVVLAAGAVAFAVVVPPPGEQFSAIYVLTEDDDGERVADGYPEELDIGDSAELVVGVDNHEHDRTEYTVVLLEQQVRFENATTGDPVNRTANSNETNVTAVVTAQNELDRFETVLSHNESWQHTHDVTPTYTGENVRLVWLLFPGSDVPDSPSMAETEYSNHIWVDVTDTDENGG